MWPHGMYVIWFVYNLYVIYVYCYNNVNNTFRITEKYTNGSKSTVMAYPRADPFDRWRCFASGSSPDTRHFLTALTILCLHAIDSSLLCQNADRMLCSSLHKQGWSSFSLLTRERYNWEVESCRETCRIVATDQMDPRVPNPLWQLRLRNQNNIRQGFFTCQ